MRRLALGLLVALVACSSGGAAPASSADAAAPPADAAGPPPPPSDGSVAAPPDAPADVATSSPDAPAASDGATPPSWWHPPKTTTFYWDLQSAPPDNTKNVGAYDIDGWNNSAQEVAALHALGIKVVCYMDAGTYEPNRPDSNAFPAALKGAAVQGWPGELWLDVRPSGPDYATLQSIMLARFQVCQQKGFDAVEPDNIDSYTNSPGFPTAAADQIAYNEWIAETVHGLGMAVFQKNDLDQIGTLLPYFDGLLDEECNKNSECALLAPYPAAGKPAWNAEYTEDGETTAQFCAPDVSAGIVGALFSIKLDGSLFSPCANDVGKIN
jgi:hypothetical protein